MATIKRDRIRVCRQAAGILIVILICHGACHPRSPEQEDFLTAAGFLDCSICGFTEANPEHIVNEIKEPFVVRMVQGKILHSEGEPILFLGRTPLLEIRAYGSTDAEVRGIRADMNGVFRMEGVPEGPYCFKATMDGWQSVIGIIVVSKKAPQKRSIILRLLIGV